MNLKKITVGAFFALCLLIFSCEKEKKEIREASVASYENVNRELSQLDSSFLLDLSLEAKKRFINWGKIWSAIKGSVRVVAADIVGCVSSGKVRVDVGKGGITGCVISFDIVGAVTSSADKATEVFGSSSTSNKTAIKRVNSYNFDETRSVLGADHNEIMKRLFDYYDQRGISDINMDSLIVDVQTIAKKYYGADFYELSAKELKAIKENALIIKQKLSNATDEETIEYLRNCGFASKEDLNIIADYLLKIQSIDDDSFRRRYATAFARIIESSTIPLHSKQIIFNATSTAINSLSLWEENI